MSKINKERISVYLKTALQVLQANSGQLPSREVMREVEKRLKLSEYELARHEKTGYVRWESIMHFCSMDWSDGQRLMKYQARH
jgi:restriction system protein